MARREKHASQGLSDTSSQACGKPKTGLKRGPRPVPPSVSEILAPSDPEPPAHRKAPKGEGSPGADGAKSALLVELERLADAGDGGAACVLGDHYRKGDGAPQDWVMAFRWYSRGATLGDRDAQNNLGTMFFDGAGCKRNRPKAVRWYRKSAEQGNVDAQCTLALCFLHGIGVSQNDVEAYKWFHQAAAQGNTDAAGEMGTMHQYGRGVPRNLLAAADFHLIAAETGDELACSNMSDYRAELEEMALSGSEMASLFLCRIYNRGFGVEKSQPMTWAWISWAKKHCSPDADAEILQEISEAHDFYRSAVTLKNRKLGERTFAELRAAHAEGRAVV